MNYVKDAVIEHVLRGDIIKIFKSIKLEIYNKYIDKKIRILHISDIHYSGIRDFSKLDYLYNSFKLINPNYICITGDLIDSNNIVEISINKKIILDWLKKLGIISKVIISLGNHDISTRLNKKLEIYNNKLFWNEVKSIDNIKLLNNEYYEDSNVYIYGYTQSFEYYYKYKCEDKNIMLNEISGLKINHKLPNKLTICLIHSPICFKYGEVIDSLNNYNLVLSGHTHNGMVLPIIDEVFNNNIGLISPNKKLFPKVARGILIKDNIIAISAGITKLHVTLNPLIRWMNILFPVGINIIDVQNKNEWIIKTYKYHK